MPDRIQLSRARGWRMPPNTVKVDRSTMWGNPWRATEFYRPGQNTIEEATAAAVRIFRASVLGFESNGSFCRPVASIDSAIGRIIAEAPVRLRGKNLACWCRPGSPCHAEVLMELANG